MSRANHPIIVQPGAELGIPELLGDFIQSQFFILMHSLAKVTLVRNRSSRSPFGTCDCLQEDRRNALRGTRVGNHPCMRVAEMFAVIRVHVLDEIVLKLSQRRADRAGTPGDDARDGRSCTMCLSFHAMVLPVITPNQTEMKPTTTLRTTFNAAMRSSPSWKTRKVSYSNVENVLYPPMNPIGIKYLQFGLQLVFSVKIVMTKPIRKHAVMLMMNVPARKRVFSRLLTWLPTQKRKTDPTAPPIPTIKYLVIDASLLSPSNPQIIFELALKAYGASACSELVTSFPDGASAFSCRRFAWIAESSFWLNARPPRTCSACAR